MLLSIPDKKALWKEIVYETSERIDDGLFQILLNQCYLDNLERGYARIMVRNAALQRMVEQKAVKALEKAFAETLRQPVQLRILVGHPRMFERSSFTPGFASIASTTPLLPEPGSITGQDPQEAERVSLHERYGDIMGIVDNHPTFRKAGLPIEQGGWGIFPQLLTNACKEYGVMAVLNGLRVTGSQPDTKNPRGRFFDALREGQFGHKLAIAASVVG